MSADRLIGKIILNRYRVDAFIAAGGMASVYCVWDLMRSAPLAMKILHADLAEDPSMFKYFQREARALERLAHPNIVPFYGIERSDDFVFQLQAYINGPTLKEVIRHQHGPLPIQDALIYLKALSAALGYAHANGVVHCDVKPSNVIVGQGGEIYLTDFGIARHAESTTTTLGAAGTPAYMAPEQVRGEPVTPATDVYALGVVFYEMLVGKRPFSGQDMQPGLDEEPSGSSTAERIRYAHLYTRAPDPSLFVATLPPELTTVMLRALEKEPSHRYCNASEFFAAACSAANIAPDQLTDRVGPEYLPRDESVEPIHPGAAAPVKAERPWLRTMVGLWAMTVALVCITATLAFFVFRSPAAAPAIAVPTHIPESPQVPTVMPSQILPPTATPEHLPSDTPPPTASRTPLLTPTEISTWKMGRLVIPLQTTNNERGLFLLDLENDAKPHTLWSAKGQQYMGLVWSPDSQQIAFYEQSQRDLLIISSQAGNRPRTIAQECYQPTWLPDGSTLLCRQMNGSTWFVDVSTGSTTPGPVSIPGLALPDWSPLDDWLVFAILGEARGSADIYLAPTYGGQRQHISGAAKENYAPAWSHDGKWIAYQSNQDSDYSEIWIMDAEGGAPRQITDSSAGYFARGPTWSPDDRWIAYVSGPGRGDWGEVYIISAQGGEPVQITNTDSQVYDWRIHWGD